MDEFDNNFINQLQNDILNQFNHEQHFSDDEEEAFVENIVYPEPDKEQNRCIRCLLYYSDANFRGRNNRRVLKCTFCRQLENLNTRIHRRPQKQEENEENQNINPEAFFRNHHLWVSLNFGRMNIVFQHCQALHWPCEGMRKPTPERIEFTKCCNNGTI